MRVLITPFPARSHLYDMVPLAWALHTAGHEVRVASRPDIVDDITDASLIAVPVGAEIDLATAMAEDTSWDDEETADLDITEIRPEKLTREYVRAVLEWHSTVIFEGVADDIVLDDLVKFAMDWKPDLVIWDPMMFAGPIAAQACGAVHARQLFGSDYIGKLRKEFLRLCGDDPDQLGDWITRTLAQHGGEFSEELITGRCSIDITPAWLQFPLNLDYLPIRFIPYHGPVATPKWVHEKPAKPRVCITLGLSGREVMGSDTVSVKDLLAAVDGLDIEVIATLTADQLGEVPVPANTRVVDFVPLNTLLPTCAAIVNHGGNGACGGAMLFGVPQLLIPNKIWDTVRKAEALADRTAAVVVREEDVTPQAIRSALLKLLTDPSYQAGAARVRDEVEATPSPNDVVSMLERLVARKHAGSRALGASLTLLANSTEASASP